MVQLCGSPRVSANRAEHREVRENQDEIGLTAEASRARLRDGLLELAIPTTIVAAGLAFSYAGLLVASHLVSTTLFVAASFGIQSFAALVAAWVCCRTRPREALGPFTRTLWPHEIMFVGLVGLWLAGVKGHGPGALLVLGCLLWQAARTYRFFLGLGPALGPARGRARAALALVVHYGVIFVLVGTYAHVQDLFPYPAGLP